MAAASTPLPRFFEPYRDQQGLHFRVSEGVPGDCRGRYSPLGLFRVERRLLSIDGVLHRSDTDFQIMLRAPGHVGSGNIVQVIEALEGEAWLDTLRRAAHTLQHWVVVDAGGAVLLVYPAIGRLVLWDVLLDAAEHGEHQAVAQRTVVQLLTGLLKLDSKLRPDDFGWGEQAHRDRALRVALAHSPQGRLAAVLAVQRWPDHFQGGDEVMQQVQQQARADLQADLTTLDAAAVQALLLLEGGEEQLEQALAAVGSGGPPGVQAEQRLTVVRELLQVTQRSMRGMGPEQRQAVQRVLQQQQQQQQQAWQQLDALVAGMPPDVAAAVRGWAPRLFRYPARLLAAALVHGQPLPPHVGAACAYAPRSLGQLGGDGQPTARQALQLCLLRLAFLDDVLHGRISPTGQAGREAAQGHLLRLLGTRRALAAGAREAAQQRRAVPLPPAFLDQDPRLERWRSGVPAVLSEAGAQAEAEALAGRSGGDLWRDLCREYEHSLPFTAIAPLGVPGSGAGSSPQSLRQHDVEDTETSIPCTRVVNAAKGGGQVKSLGAIRGLLGRDPLAALDAAHGAAVRDLCERERVAWQDLWVLVLREPGGAAEALLVPPAVLAGLPSEAAAHQQLGRRGTAMFMAELRSALSAQGGHWGRAVCALADSISERAAGAGGRGGQLLAWLDDAAQQAPEQHAPGGHSCRQCDPRQQHGRQWLQREISAVFVPGLVEAAAGPGDRRAVTSAAVRLHGAALQRVAFGDDMDAPTARLALHPLRAGSSMLPALAALSGAGDEEAAAGEDWGDGGEEWGSAGEQWEEEEEGEGGAPPTPPPAPQQAGAAAAAPPAPRLVTLDVALGVAAAAVDAVLRRYGVDPGSRLARAARGAWAAETLAAHTPAFGESHAVAAGHALLAAVARMQPWPAEAPPPPPAVPRRAERGAGEGMDVEGEAGMEVDWEEGEGMDWEEEEEEEPPSPPPQRQPQQPQQRAAPAPFLPAPARVPHPLAHLSLGEILQRAEQSGFSWHRGYFVRGLAAAGASDEAIFDLGCWYDTASAARRCQLMRDAAAERRAVWRRLLAAHQEVHGQ